MTDWLTNLDLKTLGWIHDTLSSGFLDRVMPWISFIGNDGLVWILAACALLCTRRYRRNGILLLAGLAAGYLLGDVLMKPLIARVRPVWPYPVPALLTRTPAGYSFPSGHAFSSFTAATILALTDRKFGAFALPLACLIALSRLYLYVHFPSDVLAGAVLGAVVGGLVYWLGQRIARNGGAEKG
jgi:undecaprenyl-diphosphatase